MSFLKSLLGICVVPFFTINAQEASKIQIPYENLYRIENDVLINYQGTRYPKIVYQGQLHEDLAFVLKDPEQTNIIQQAYSRHILPFLTNEIQEAFSKVLLKVCFLFGSERFSPENALITALNKENAVVSEWCKQHRDQLTRFCQEANQPARPNIIPRKKPTLYTIAILTTSESGGNHSVANALESFLSSQKNIRPIVIDVETVAKESDPIMLATGAVTYDGIYASLFQQANQWRHWARRDEVSKQLAKYIPSSLGLKLKELMRQISPDLILSTRSYTTDDIPLCTLGVPFRMIHCDYELSFFLMDLYGTVQADMLKFWLPGLEPKVFRPFFERHQRLDLYNEQDDTETLMKKIALMAQEPLEDIKGQFELLGYPIRSEFCSIWDAQKLKDLRKKWDIQADEIPILVTMGKNGAGVLEEIFDQLKSSFKQGLHLKYIFVCGNNSSLKEKLIKKASGNKKFSIQGLLLSQEMNELMNLCPVTISKPGGGMTAEVLATGTYLLMKCTYPWEEANGSVIEKMGLGQKSEANVDLSLQVESCLKKPRNKLPQGNDWKKLLQGHLDCLRDLK
jgi:UDP-N-acetylglucosamine:LPS N-acetylglucosamine transferase